MSLSTRLAVSTASAALVAALLPLTAAPASAEVQRSTDAAGDTSTEDGPGPQQRTADIVGFRTNHGERRVTVRLDMAAMVDGGEFFATAVVKTDDGRFRLDYGRARRGDIQGVDVLKGTGGKAKVVRCDGVAAQFLLEEQAVKVSAPRRCLGNPTWVQTGALVETRPPQVWAGIYTDDARREGGADEQRIKVSGRRLTSG